MQIFAIEDSSKSIDVVAGMIWHPLVPDNFKKDLPPLAAETRTDLYVYRRSAKAMVGLTDTESGARPGQVALGMIVSNYLEETESDTQNALIALKLPGFPDLFSYLMISDGFILADGDQLGTEEEIRGRFISDLSAEGWDCLICPEDWTVRKSKPVELAEMLPLVKDKLAIPKTWRLQPTKPPVAKTILQGLAIFALLAVPYYGYQYWAEANAKQAAAQFAAQQAQREDAERNARLTAEPWPAIPRAGSFLFACQKSIEAMGLIAGNWGVNEFVCEANIFTIKWERSNGEAWVTHLKSLHPSAVLSDDGAFATATTQFNPPPIASAEGKIPQAIERIDQLRDLENAYGMTVRLNLKPNAAAPEIGANGTPLPMPHWKSFQVELDTQLSPMTALSAIDAPGFRVTKLRGSYKEGLLKYQLTGTQYATP